VNLLTRRSALALLFVAAPSVALADHRKETRRGVVVVDVSPLRRSGDNTDADFLAAVLPGYLVEQFGPQKNVAARIDSITYGPPGSSGGSNSRAFDTIEGVGRVDGREFPIRTSIQTAVTLPDVGGAAARVRQDQLARSFAQWLAQEPGSWR
jgi:hypothetical protein